MGLSNLLSILDQYRGASAAAPPPNVHEDYSRVAEQATPDDRAGGLAHAFRSTDTQPFPQMLSTLFSNSNGEQRAEILQKLLAAAGPSLFGSGAFHGLSSLLNGGQWSVAAAQANQIPANQRSTHSNTIRHIVDEVSGFYAHHPAVGKALGAGALALIMSHMSRR